MKFELEPMDCLADMQWMVGAEHRFLNGFGELIVGTTECEDLVDFRDSMPSLALVHCDDDDNEMLLVTIEESDYALSGDSNRKQRLDTFLSGIHWTRSSAESLFLASVFEVAFEAGALARGVNQPAEATQAHQPCQHRPSCQHGAEQAGRNVLVVSEADLRAVQPMCQQHVEQPEEPVEEPTDRNYLLVSAPTPEEAPQPPAGDVVILRSVDPAPSDNIGHGG